MGVSICTCAIVCAASQVGSEALFDSTFSPFYRPSTPRLPLHLQDFFFVSCKAPVGSVKHGIIFVRPPPSVDERTVHSTQFIAFLLCFPQCPSWLYRHASFLPSFLPTSWHPLLHFLLTASSTSIPSPFGYSTSALPFLLSPVSFSVFHTAPSPWGCHPAYEVRGPVLQFLLRVPSSMSAPTRSRWPPHPDTASSRA